MMLVDGNLDGAVSPEELQKVLNFVKAREFCCFEDILISKHWDLRLFNYLTQPFLDLV